MARAGGDLDRMIAAADGLTPDQAAAERVRAENAAAALARLTSDDDARTEQRLKLKALREAKASPQTTIGSEPHAAVATE